MLSHYALTAFTDCGDSAMLTALCFVSFLYLWMSHCRTGAKALLFSFALAALETGLLKTLFLGCLTQWQFAGIHSPSGHMALFTALSGSYLLLLKHNMKTFRWRAPAAIAALLVAAMGYSRVALHYHSVGEVVLGFVIGLQVIIMTYFLHFRNKLLPYFNVTTLTALLVLTGVLFHGLRLPAESLIHWLALDIKKHVSLCASGTWK